MGAAAEPCRGSLEDVTTTVRDAVPGGLSPCRVPFPGWDPPAKPASLSSASAQRLCCPQLYSALDTVVGEERERTNPCECCVGAASTAALNSQLPSGPSRPEELSIRSSASAHIPSQGSYPTHLNPEPWQPLQEELIPHLFGFPCQEGCRGCGQLPNKV